MAALRKIIEKGFEGLFCDYQNLLDRIRSGYDASSNSSDKEAYGMALDTRGAAAGRSGRASRHRLGGRHRHLDRDLPLQQPEGADRHHQPAGRRRREFHAWRRSASWASRSTAATLADDWPPRPFAPVRNVHGHPHAADRGLPPAKGARRFDARSALPVLLLLSRVRPPRRRRAAAEYVQAVEFPYYLYPRALWERELVWLKTIGVRTVEFSIPWNWHQLQPGEFDFTGRTSPRRDLVGFVRLLRKLGTARAGCGRCRRCAAGSTAASPLDAARRAARLAEATRTAAGPADRGHGGPIAYVEGTRPGDRRRRPARARRHRLRQRSRRARRAAAKPSRRRAASLLWTDVEDALYPAGWAADRRHLLRQGAVGLGGDERPATAALRRDAALLRDWAPLLAHLQPGRHAASRRREAAAKASPPSSWPVRGRLRRQPSPTRGRSHFTTICACSTRPRERTLVIPRVSRAARRIAVAAASSVSTRTRRPVPRMHQFSRLRNTSSTPPPNCSPSNTKTASSPWSSPRRRPAKSSCNWRDSRSGPFLAGGKPTEFDWDEKNLRARLAIPAGKGAGQPRAHRHRHRGARNFGLLQRSAPPGHRAEESRCPPSTLPPRWRQRSRLRLPEGYTATPHTKSPNEIDYEVAVPADALHGDYANLALEADGMLLGRARLQISAPLRSACWSRCVLHFGPQTEMTPEPADRRRRSEGRH